MFETLIFARTTVTKQKYRILSLNPISYLINLLHGFAEKHPEEDRKAVPLPKYWKLYSCTFFSFANFRLSFCYSAVPSFRVLRSPVFQLLSRSRREEVGCNALRGSSQTLFLPQLLPISQSDWLIFRCQLESRQRCYRQCVTLLIALWKEKKNLFFDIDIAVKKQIECGIALSVLLSTTICVIKVVKMLSTHEVQPS